MLSRLPLDQLCVRSGKQSDRLLAQVGRGYLGGAGHEEVTRQDGHGVIPVGVGRACASSGVGFVDHVVVIEGAEVYELGGDSGLNRTVVSRRPKFGREKGEEWPETLAARQQQMLGNLRQIGVVRCRRFEEALLDAAQLLPNSGNTNKTLEVFHC